MEDIKLKINRILKKHNLEGDTWILLIIVMCAFNGKLSSIDDFDEILTKLENGELK